MAREGGLGRAGRASGLWTGRGSGVSRGGVGVRWGTRAGVAAAGAGRSGSGCSAAVLGAALGADCGGPSTTGSVGATPNSISVSCGG